MPHNRNYGRTLQNHRAQLEIQDLLYKIIVCSQNLFFLGCADVCGRSRGRSSVVRMSAAVCRARSASPKKRFRADQKKNAFNQIQSLIRV
jgi:hypothetical protein